MKQRIPWATITLALMVLAFVSFKALAANLAVSGPVASGQAVTGAGGDGYVCRWSGFYGGMSVVQSNYLFENATGEGVGTTTPLSKMDVSGNVAIGSFAGANAAPTNGLIVSGSVGLGTSSPGAAGLNVVAANASSTGTVVNTAASPTADIEDWKINGSTAIVIGPQGHIVPRIYSRQQVDTLVPDYIGAIINVNNMISTVFFPNGFSVCQATGTAVAQWSVVGGTHGVNMNGCGSLN